jgi:peptidoglycan/LPS O-acetylase OafA/YrhL
MNRPPTATFLYGNWAIVLAVWGLCGLLLLQWWEGMLSDVVPVVTVLIMACTANARRQVVRYKRWKRTWDAMGGVPPRKHHWTFVVGIVVWVLCGLVVLGLDRRQPGMMALSIGFAVGSVVMIFACIRSDQRAKGRSRTSSRKVTVVTICLPVPRHSPGPSAYCADLPQLPSGAPQ